MAKILLGVTGSVAAIRTPDLYRALQAARHEVRVVGTQTSLYFWNPLDLDPAKSERNRALVTLDEDEWPGDRYQRGDEVLHIELRRWADLFLLAPLDANTLAKLAHGLSDNCLTCVWRAWDPARSVVLAPAMNTLMWEHPLTRRHFRQLASDHVGLEPPANLNLEALLDWTNQRQDRLQVVPPQSKRLACGDIGVGALADVADIVAAVARVLHLPSSTSSG